MLLHCALPRVKKQEQLKIFPGDSDNEILIEGRIGIEENPETLFMNLYHSVNFLFKKTK